MSLKFDLNPPHQHPVQHGWLRAMIQMNSSRDSSLDVGGSCF
jgi:hypothetical protein